MVGKPVYVVPYLNDLHLPEEDGLGLERRLAWESEPRTSGKNSSNKDSESAAKPLVVVVAFPHTAIADDLCPLERDPRFRVQWRRRRIPRPYPHTATVILPGSRLTRLDLKWLHDSGWGDFIKKHVAAGGQVLGICGGYQMLGWSVEDPGAVEGVGGSKQGLGLLPISTTMAPPSCKVVAPRKGKLYPSNTPVEGFELHCGRSQIMAQISGSGLGHQIQPLLFFDDGKAEGMCSGPVRGTYVHGILRSPAARAELLVPKDMKLQSLDNKKNQFELDPLEKLAKHLETCGLDYETLKLMVHAK